MLIFFSRQNDSLRLCERKINRHPETHLLPGVRRLVRKMRSSRPDIGLCRSRQRTLALTRVRPAEYCIRFGTYACWHHKKAVDRVAGSSGRTIDSLGRPVYGWLRSVDPVAP